MRNPRRYVEEQLRAAGYTPVRQTFTFRGEGRNRKQVESFNILAETGGSAANTVVVGGHLDSVREGPGINDNASGVAAILETAKWMKENGITPVNRVVFAFWGAEEDGLYGSQHYVDELSKAEKDQTAANLNVDMLASPNGVRSIHDGDGSDFGDAGPKGSKEIEELFFRFFQENSLPAESTVFDGGSDYDAFMQAGIPVGGLFSGDVEKKTRPRCSPTAAWPARSSIPATTVPATPSAIPTPDCSRRCPPPWPTPPRPTHWRPRARTAASRWLGQPSFVAPPSDSRGGPDAEADRRAT